MTPSFFYCFAVCISSTHASNSVKDYCKSNDDMRQCCAFEDAKTLLNDCTAKKDKCCKIPGFPMSYIQCCGQNRVPENCIMKHSEEERKKRCINVKVENKGALIVKAETTNIWGISCSGKTNSKDCHQWGRLHAGQDCSMVMVKGGKLKIDVVDDGKEPYEFSPPAAVKMVVGGHIHGPTFSCETI